MEYYSALRKEEILPYAITWIKMEDIMLSEKASNTAWFNLYEVSKTVSNLQKQSSMVVAREWGKGEIFNRYNILVMQDE